MFPIAAILGLAFALPVQPADPTLPPPTAQLRYTAIGRGVQIYRCTAQTTTQPITFQWVFKEPEATLIDPTTGQQLGKHTAGPTWAWKDGSALVGKVLQKSSAPDAAAIPWLLLEAHSTGGPGVLSGITLIRRSETQAGISPTTGCDAQHQDNLIRVPYRATYTFYTAQ